MALVLADKTLNENDLRPLIIIRNYPRFRGAMPVLRQGYLRVTNQFATLSRCARENPKF